MGIRKSIGKHKKSKAAHAQRAVQRETARRQTARRAPKEGKS